MMRKKNRMYRVAAVVLSICMLCSTFVFTATDYFATETDTVFHLYVDTPDSELFVGEFIIDDGEVYVAFDTAKKMQLNIAVNETEKISLVDVLAENGYSAEFYYADKLLYIRERSEYDELLDIMDEVYDEKAYNMYYWQSSPYYEEDIAFAAVADCIKNFSYVSYLIGEEEKQGYEDAFWRIITPDDDADMRVLDTAGETGEKISDTYDLASDTVELIGERMEVEDLDSFVFEHYDDNLNVFLKTFGDVLTITQADDLKHLVGFTDVMSSTTKAAVRGLDGMLEKGFASKGMYDRGRTVVNIYQDKDSIERLFWDRLISRNIVEFYDGRLEDVTTDFLMGTNKIYVDIVNMYLDDKIHSQQQINATLEAATMLEIQGECAEYYTYLATHLNKNDLEQYDQDVLMMHDLTVAYLLASAEAYKSTAIDDDMKKVFATTLKNIEVDLAILAEYHEEDFASRERLESLEERLILYANDMHTEGQPLLLDALIPDGIISIESPYELVLTFEGATQNVRISTGVLADVYYDEDGHIVAIVKEENGEAIVAFYDLDGYYTTTIEADAPDNAWISETTITCELPGNPTFAPEDYLYRGGTGFWYYRIVIENGIPVQAYY